MKYLSRGVRRSEVKQFRPCAVCFAVNENDAGKGLRGYCSHRIFGGRGHGGINVLLCSDCRRNCC